MTFKRKTLFTSVLSVCLTVSSISVAKPAQNIDQILINGQIYTAVSGEPLQEAIALYQDTIVQVGSNEAIKALANKNTKVTDLNKGVVLPGLIDSHIHPIMGGIESVTANMHDMYVPIELLEAKIKNFQQDGTAQAGDILVVNGMSSEQWSNLGDLNRVFNKGVWESTPMALVGSDHHTSWANRALLARAGVTPEHIQSLPPEEQTNFGKDTEHRPNGFLVDSAWDFVSAVIPALEETVMYQGGLEAVRLLNSHGVTAWLDVATNALPNQGLFNVTNTPDKVGMLPLYQALSENGDLTVHAAGLHVINSKSDASVLGMIEEINAGYANVKNLKMIGVKVFADGVVEYPAQSAAMHGKYSNSNESGELLFDPATFAELVNVADQKGVVVHTHAIGDKAVTETLNAIAHAREKRNSGVPHTITHAQLVDSNDYSRFKELDVIASMQLLWAYPDVYIQEMVKPYISEANYAGMYPAASLSNAKAEIAGASDYPVSSPNPFLAMAVAMTRASEDGKETLNGKEALPLEPLLQAYTIQAAKAMQWDDEIGSLSPGKKADMILLDQNIFKISPQKLRETRVLWTMFEGKKVYESTVEQQ